MEDLNKTKQNIKIFKNSDIKRTKHNNRMVQVPFYMLRMILTYKALHAGKRVETVSPYNTSRIDCRTQSTANGEKKGCRFYTADGRVFDADWNAAINILNRKHPSSFTLPIDGRLNLRCRHLQQAISELRN